MPQMALGQDFIGRIDIGIDFLGYHFNRAGLTLARKTIETFVERVVPAVHLQFVPDVAIVDPTRIL